MEDYIEGIGWKRKKEKIVMKEDMDEMDILKEVDRD